MKSLTLNEREKNEKALHFDRTVGRDRHHCHSGSHAVAGTFRCQRARKNGKLYKQAQTNGAGLEHVCQRLQWSNA